MCGEDGPEYKFGPISIIIRYIIKIYVDYFELVLDSVTKNPKAAAINVFGIISGELLLILIMVCVCKIWDQYL